jgi:hypothetical protein
VFLFLTISGNLCPPAEKREKIVFFSGPTAQLGPRPPHFVGF